VTDVKKKLKFHGGDNLSDRRDIILEVAQLLADGERIQAVKLLRAHIRLPLEQLFGAVDTYMEPGVDRAPHQRRWPQWITDIVEVGEVDLCDVRSSSQRSDVTVVVGDLPRSEDDVLKLKHEATLATCQRLFDDNSQLRELRSAADKLTDSLQRSNEQAQVRITELERQLEAERTSARRALRRTEVSAFRIIRKLLDVGMARDD
jgi:hypothetical protein